MGLSTEQRDQIRGIGEPVLVTSHRRSGTHLLLDLIRKHFPSTRPKLRRGESIFNLNVSIDRLRPGHHNPISVNRVINMLKRVPRPLIQTHEFPGFSTLSDDARELLELLQDRTTNLYVHRDGRDAIASSHVFEMFHSPERTPASISTYLRTESHGMQRSAHWNAHVSAWIDVPNVQVIAFGGILGDTASTLMTIGETIGDQPLLVTPLLPKRLSGKLSGRIQRFLGTAEATTIVGRKRASDRPPSWRETFTPDDRALFDEQAGELLVRLGYEPDRSWVSAGR